MSIPSCDCLFQDWTNTDRHAQLLGALFLAPHTLQAATREPHIRGRRTKSTGVRAGARLLSRAGKTEFCCLSCESLGSGSVTLELSELRRWGETGLTEGSSWAAAVTLVSGDSTTPTGCCCSQLLLLSLEIQEPLFIWKSLKISGSLQQDG